MNKGKSAPSIDRAQSARFRRSELQERLAASEVKIAKKREEIAKLEKDASFLSQEIEKLDAFLARVGQAAASAPPPSRDVGVVLGETAHCSATPPALRLRTGDDSMENRQSSMGTGRMVITGSPAGEVTSHASASSTTPRGASPALLEERDRNMSIECAMKAANELWGAADARESVGDGEAARMLRAQSSEMFARVRAMREASLTRFLTSTPRLESRASEWEGLEKAIELSLEESASVESAKKRLQSALGQWGFCERPVPGDNNCQFHAFQDQLLNMCGYQDPEKISPKKLRMFAVETLRKYGDQYMEAEDAPGERTTLKHALGKLTDQQWEEYLAEMSLHGKTWGDEATILALAVKFQAEVFIVSNISDGCIRTVTPPGVWNIPVERRIYLGHYHEYHYISCGFAEAMPRNSPPRVNHRKSKSKNVFKRMKDTLENAFG